MGNTRQTRVKKGHSREPAHTKEISEDIREEADEVLLKLFTNLALFSSCVCVNLTLKSPRGTEKSTTVRSPPMVRLATRWRTHWLRRARQRL